ncbi:hypothetical protein M3Y97_01126300 [Aphelenchoides bicaudatus]|nr:hypothetical protein M3Y97_01126300 [Aphelenchoides bicaudatus]
MDLKLIALVLLFIGLCESVKVEKREVDNLSDYFKIDNDRRKEWENIKELAHLKTRQPDAFQLIYSSFLQVHKDFKGSQEARHFLSFYTQRINQISAASPDVYHQFNAELQTEWEKLTTEQKNELIRWNPKSN